MSRLLASGAAFLLAMMAVACHGPYPTPTPVTTSAKPVTVASIVLTPDKWDIPQPGGSLELIVTTSANSAGGVVAPHARVDLRASSGQLSIESVETDYTGHARVIWSGTTTATVTAQSGDLLATSTIRIVDRPANPPNPPPPPPPPDSPLPPGALLMDIIPTSDPPVRSGAPFGFAGSGHDGTGEVPGITYEWDFDGDGRIDLQGQRIAYAFPRPGEYVISVRGTAPDGRTATGRLPVGVAAPLMAITLTASATTVHVDELVTLVASTPPDTTRPTSYRWDLDGDGRIDQESGSDFSATVGYRYAAPGVYKVTVTVRGADGLVVEKTISITVVP